VVQAKQTQPGFVSLPLWEKSSLWTKRFNRFFSEIAGNIVTIGRKEYLFQSISRAMATACKHPRVRIVSRHEDSEFVECLDCGEVFDSDEFHDMEIEESAESKNVKGDDKEDT
jgi:hypothetical protein